MLYVVAGCSLFVVCCQLFVVPYLLLIVYCMFFDACCVLFVAWRVCGLLLFVVCGVVLCCL